VAVIAVACDDFIARFQRHPHPDNDRFLADIEMTEPADQAHAIHLAGLLFEPSDQEHLSV
jgi:hypothetical protein